ncbi:MAG TPA: hypothetical protein VGE43_19605 [Acidimicrobiales bacterium]
MSGWIVCAACEGRRYAKVPAERPSWMVDDGTPYTVRRDCDACGGEGRVFDRTGTVNLTASLAELVGDEKAEEVLNTLDANRDDLAAWLHEIGFLAPSGWTLVPHHETSAWGKPGDTEWVPVKRHTAGGDCTPLFRVRAA